MRTQILINNKQIDLLKDVSLNITKQLIDIQSPEKRKTDRTLTIEIPGSKTNDKLFSYIFEVNIDLYTSDSGQETPNFNPNKKADAIIFIDNFQQLKGYCQLTDITVEHRDKITYKIVCYGEIGDLFAKIDNQVDEEDKALKGELTDLDFSEFDHVYHRGNIANSWDTEIIENGSGTAVSLGKGYVYPMIDYGYQKNYVSGTKTDQWGVEQFRPAIYTKQYIDKIFEKAGYTYTSNFLNSDFFKRLIVPFNSEQFLLTKEEVDSRLFNVGLSAELSTDFLPDSGSFAGVSPILFDIDNVSPNYFDNSFQYDVSTGIFTCNKTGKYQFKSSVDCHVKNTSFNAYDYHYNDFQIVISIVHRVSGVDNHLCSNTGKVLFYPPTHPVTVGVNYTSSQVVVELLSPEVTIKAGEQIFVAPIRFDNLIRAVGYGEVYRAITDTGYKLIINSSSGSNTFFSNAVPNAVVNEGDDIPLNVCIPTGIKQRDFLGSIIKAFNLYVEPNPDKDNDLIIEPRADYYTGQSTDWTHKLDISKEFTISPMAALDAGEYHFTYKEDGDYLNKNYKDQYDRTYGDYKLKINNDFVKSSKKIELIFAPTPSFRAKDDPTERILPYMAFVDSKNTVSTKTSKIRLLYYGGMKDCEPWSFLASGFSGYQFDQYPYSGHLNDPFNSTFDLNFAPPFQIYYQSTADKKIDYTNQNLYTRYWYAQMKEITDKNSKLVEGWFYLTPADIQGLSFRKYYFIKDAYYRLLKIENYDPVFNKVTKCKFLKVQEFDAPLQVRTGINGGRGIFGTAGTVYQIPTVGGTASPAGSPSSGPRVVTGWNNTVDSTTLSVLLTGVGNNVLAGGERIHVIGGGGNLIEAGLQDVTLINSSGITVTEPGVLYLNNQRFYSGAMGDAVSITTDNSPYTLTTATRTLFCDATEGEITVNLPTAEGNNGKIFEIIKTDDSVNTVYIDGYSSETINGSAGQTLVSAYDKITIVCNSTTWFKL